MLRALQCHIKDSLQGTTQIFKFSKGWWCKRL